MLNTGWKQWDKYLSNFVDKQVNILEVGSYEGDATSWFLKNICNNKKSKVYAIDTWQGSPEYGNINFNKIEKTFDYKTKNTGRIKQLKKMKMTSFEGLIKLNNKKVLFDIIYIDASHEAKDVLFDGILAWNILKEDGVIIFDDYKWTKLNKNYFRPKIAIDALMNVLTPERDILYIGWQVILKKKFKKNFEKPIKKNLK